MNTSSLDVRNTSCCSNCWLAAIDITPESRGRGIEIDQRMLTLINTDDISPQDEHVRTKLSLYQGLPPKDLPTSGRRVAKIPPEGPYRFFTKSAGKEYLAKRGIA